MRKTITCNKCGREKKHHSFGLCIKCYGIQYRQKNRNKILARKKGYYQKNRNMLVAKQKEYYQKHEEERRQYVQKSRDKISARRKELYQNGKKNSVRITKEGSQRYWVYNTDKRVHTAIAEKTLGRRLRRGECVHHIDGNGLNNLHSNLLICTKSYHTWLHHETRRRQLCYS